MLRPEKLTGTPLLRPQPQPAPRPVRPVRPHPARRRSLARLLADGDAPLPHAHEAPPYRHLHRRPDPCSGICGQSKEAGGLR